MVALSISPVLTHVYVDNCLICLVRIHLVGSLLMEIAKELWKENGMMVQMMFFFVVLIGFYFTGCV